MSRTGARGATRVGKASSAVVGLAVVMALLFVAGCGQSSDQGQALEEQQQENAELQEKLEAQEKEQEKAEEQREAAEREELQQENEELQKELEAQKEEGNEPQETSERESGTPEPEADSPEVVIQTVSPTQAPQGVVGLTPGYDVQAITTEEEEALRAAIAYYQEVEVGDYYTTHSLLSVDDQNLFPLDTWVAANTELDSAAGEFVVTDAYPESVGNGYPAYAVTLTVYLTDGSVSPRKTYFTNEGNGYWAHWLSTEEMNLFNSAL